jgi:hypothetical protein
MTLLQHMKHILAPVIKSNTPKIQASMKTLKSILALAALTLLLASCGDSDCKNCSINGDYIGEYCGDARKSLEADGAKCK